MRSLILVILALLAACATTTTTAPDGTTTTTTVVDVSQSKLAVATHADLQAAAKWADDHGYPARAAVWRAHDAHLTAVEAQVSACANAIRAALPKPLTGATPPTPFLALEMSAEAVGQFSGVPATVKINCAPLPVPVLPILPKP